MERVKLVGKYFHTFTGGDIKQVQIQGRVEEYIGTDFFLVNVYSFLTGEYSHSEIVSFTTMLRGGWLFYLDQDAMDESYQNYWSRVEGRKNPRSISEVTLAEVSA